MSNMEQTQGVPAGWKLATVSDGDIRIYGPDKESWLIRKDNGEGFYDFIHRFFAAMLSAAPQAQPVAEVQAKRADRMKPTAYRDRFADAVARLCCGRRAPDDMIDGWLTPGCEDNRLQHFAADNGPAWAQGIVLLDAADLLAETPTEGVEHGARPTAQSPAQAQPVEAEQATSETPEKTPTGYSRPPNGEPAHPEDWNAGYEAGLADGHEIGADAGRLPVAWMYEHDGCNDEPILTAVRWPECREPWNETPLDALALAKHAIEKVWLDAVGTGNGEHSISEAARARVEFAADALKLGLRLPDALRKTGVESPLPKPAQPVEAEQAPAVQDGEERRQLQHLIDDIVEEADQDGHTYYRIRDGADVLFSNMVGACARLLAQPEAQGAAAEADSTDLADFLANTLGFVGDVDDAAAEIVAFLASKVQPAQPVEAEQAATGAHGTFPAPDLRGIDGATHSEWRFLRVPANEMLIQEKDLPEIIKRACLAYVSQPAQPVREPMSEAGEPAQGATATSKNAGCTPACRGNLWECMKYGCHRLKTVAQPSTPPAQTDEPTVQG